MGPDKTLLVDIPKTLAAKTDNLSGLLLTFRTLVNCRSTFLGPTDLTGFVFGDKIILEKSTVTRSPTGLELYVYNSHSGSYTQRLY